MRYTSQAPVRDYMLSVFTKQSSMRNKDELEKNKCSLISTYSSNLTLVMALYSLRVQAMRHYEGIVHLLDRFPATRQAHFIMGEPSKADGYSSSKLAKQTSTDSSVRMIDSRAYRSRPHQLISNDGKVLLNLWYIPHISEVGRI